MQRVLVEITFYTYIHLFRYEERKYIEPDFGEEEREKGAHLQSGTMSGHSILEVKLTWMGEIHGVIERALSAGNHLTGGGCLSFYAREEFGGWEGKYPAKEHIVALQATYNPIRTTRDQAFEEFKRVINKGFPGQEFIPCYELTGKVHIFKA